jgi:phosphoribosylformimino-5-aminoimidazole carboxamide ribotide isomerase
MFIIPVIDIRDGKCVRAIDGLGDYTSYYVNSPITIAKLFRKENFRAIHITDLDGVLSGEMKNFDLIKQISKSVDIPLLLGGGINNFENAKRAIEELGVYRVVIGTAALFVPELISRIIKEYSASKVAVAIDEKLNNVVKDGWIESANITPLEFAIKMEKLGVQRIIYQDVTRVGNLSGPNIARLLEIARHTKLKITAAGGICDYRDLKALSDLQVWNIDSVTVLRALYENKFPCQNLWRDLEKLDISLELPHVK